MEKPEDTHSEEFQGRKPKDYSFVEVVSQFVDENKQWMEKREIASSAKSNYGAKIGKPLNGKTNTAEPRQKSEFMVAKQQTCRENKFKLVTRFCYFF